MTTADTLTSEGVSSRGTSRAKGGKYLTFQLKNETYGIEILKVQEIIEMMTVTRVPRAPEFVRGVINLRGRVIPVVDLRRKFGLPPEEYTERTCIIVVHIAAAAQTITMGLIVDEVAEVLQIDEEQVEAPPAFGSQIDTNFMLGMGKVAGKVLILLDVENVVISCEKETMREMAEK